MSAMAVPASPAEALSLMETLAGVVADADAAELPTPALADGLQGMERVSAVLAAAQGKYAAAFEAKDGHLEDGQKTPRTWIVNFLGATKGQAAQYRALQRLWREHPVLWAGLRGKAVTKSLVLQLAQWTRKIPAEYRAKAEEIVVAAAVAGAGLRVLAAMCEEIRCRTAPPDPDGPDPRLDRGVSLDATFEGAGLLRGELTPECAAMVTAVLDALSGPQPGGDLRTRPQRCHDALEEAMRRLLASGLLPQRAGQPTKALVHIGFHDLLEMDVDSVLQDTWIGEYRARWAAQRAAAAVSPGDGGAWLEGDAARAVAVDAMFVPVVLGDIDPGAIEQLITCCVEFDRIRRHGSSRGAGGAGTADGSDAGAGAVPDGPGPGGSGAVPAGPGQDAASEGERAAAGARRDQVLAMLEHQILAAVIQIVSGQGGVASFLRRHLLGKGLNGPSLPLDVGQTDDIPVHLRRLVALRDQGCQFPGGCGQPAAGCHAHHVVHRADGGRTSLTNLKDFCAWHHQVVLHQLGWQLTVHPDGTSQARSPNGKIIRSHGPPPAPG